MSIPIDWNIVSKKVEAGASGIEIAAFLGCHRDTLYDRCVADHGILWSEFSANKKAKGDLTLREAQFENATKHNNTTMQIWLGKQRLGQRENIVENSAPNDANLNQTLDFMKTAKVDDAAEQQTDPELSASD